MNPVVVAGIVGAYCTLAGIFLGVLWMCLLIRDRHQPPK